MQAVPGGFLYPGPREVDNRATPLFMANLAAQLSPALAAGLETSTNDRGGSVRAAYVNWAWRALDGWIGKKAVGFSAGADDGIVLNERTAFTGGAIGLGDVSVPVIGQLSADVIVARMRRSGTVTHPWFQATRITISPHNNVAIGFNRAAIFGGEQENSITPARIALMLLGLPDVSGKDSDFENQVASIELLWRTPLRTWPLALHAEYGADDSGYAFLNVPAISAGIELVRVPGAEQIGIGGEAVYFSRRCCSYPAWYRHGALGDGWTDRGRVLGHEMGGDGTELAMTVDWVASSKRSLASLRVFHRHRGIDNLFAPDRMGNSVGGELRVLLSSGPWQFELGADGEQWSEERAAGLRLLGSRWF